MTPVLWALGVVILVFAARELVEWAKRRDPAAARVGTLPVEATTEPIGAPGLMITTKPLAGIPSIRNFFRTNETPIYFVSATAFNLLGIDRWVRNFRFVNYYDSFDGTHPNVFVPKEQTPRASSRSRRSSTTCSGTRRSATS